MKKLTLAFILLLCAVLSGCTAFVVVPEEPSDGGIITEDVTAGTDVQTTAFDAAPQEHTRFFQRNEVQAGDANVPYDDFLGGLTAEQMSEDFESLIVQMKETYPYFGVLERQGIDFEAILAQYRADITVCKNDLDFANLLFEFIDTLENTGHLCLLPPSMYHGNTEMFRLLKYSFDDEQTQEMYERFKQVYLAGQTNQSSNFQDENVVCELLDDGTAYIKINGFGGDFAEHEEPILNAFYDQITDYSDVIIDIRGNDGGSPYNFTYILDRIGTTQTMFSYSLFHSDAEKIRYARLMGTNIIFPISALGIPLSESVRADIDAFGLDSYFYERITSAPEAYRKAQAQTDFFQGRIWLLVDENTYSAADMLANFCKDTGYATVVGTQTGGDGGGLTAHFYQLPNSKLIYRYSIYYVVNCEGESSVEYGTTPDILCESSEAALERCLEEIAALK